jgi:molecular chaperone IbpA
MATTLKPFDPSIYNNLTRSLVGFDRLFSDQYITSGKYPPCNIIMKDEDHYTIEVAIAGFTKEEISISVNQERLTITGKRKSGENENPHYVHRGLALRDFEQSYILAEFMAVQNATIENGLLHIALERIIPEELKPRLIEIS